MMKAQKQITATHERDSKHYHRYVIDSDQGVMGVIYTSKAEQVPNQLMVQLKTKADKENGSSE